MCKKVLGLSRVAAPKRKLLVVVGLHVPSGLKMLYREPGQRHYIVQSHQQRFRQIRRKPIFVVKCQTLLRAKARSEIHTWKKSRIEVNPCDEMMILLRGRPCRDCGELFCFTSDSGHRMIFIYELQVRSK